MMRPISAQVKMMTSNRRTIPAVEHDEVDKIAGEHDVGQADHTSR